MKSRRSLRTRRAFTLLELMVAIAITAIIVTVLVGITGTATEVWTRSRSEVRASRQAKLFLDTMAKDFESMVTRRGNTFEWLVAKIESGAGLQAVAKSNPTNDAVALTFLTGATDRYFGQVGSSYDEGGDVSCVAYRTRYDDPVGDGSGRGVNTFILYRRLVNPDEAFDNLLGKPDLDSAFNTSYGPDATDPDNFVCENVCQFTVTFLVEVSKTGSTVKETIRLPLGAGGGNKFSLKGTGIQTDVTHPQYTPAEINLGRLTGVELGISVISDGGLARIDAKGEGLTDEDYQRQVRHYARQVVVPSM